MDIHDGNIVQWSTGGKFFFYGMGYQDCVIEHGKIPPQECPGIYRPYGACGFRTDHALRVYSSPDLASWTLEADDALPIDSRPYGIYFRPKVVFNAATEQYVLWINFLANNTSPLAAYPDAAFAVFTSPSPGGPFDTLVTPRANLGVTGGGDFSVLVDDDSDAATAYLAYDAWGNGHRVVVEQLNEAYTDSLVTDGPQFSSGPLTPENNEAPVLFKRSGWFYLLYGHTCCFCKEGGGAAVLVARNPLTGPWQPMGGGNTDASELNPRVPRSLNHTIRGQNSFVIKVPSAGSPSTYVFVSDLWSTATDGLKSHDLQYWTPLAFNDTLVADAGGDPAPVIAPFEWLDWFLLQV